MSKTYWIGCTLMGVGAGFMYLAGVKDGRQEAGKKQIRIWSDASADDSEVGVVGDVRGQRDGNGTSGDAA